MSSCFYPKCQTNGTDYPSAAAGLAPTVATATADNQPLDVRWSSGSCWARTKEGRRPKPRARTKQKGRRPKRARAERKTNARDSKRTRQKDHESRRISKFSGIAKQEETDTADKNKYNTKDKKPNDLFYAMQK